MEIIIKEGSLTYIKALKDYASAEEMLIGAYELISKVYSQQALPDGFGHNGHPKRLIFFTLGQRDFNRWCIFPLGELHRVAKEAEVYSSHLATYNPSCHLSIPLTTDP